MAILDSETLRRIADQIATSSLSDSEQSANTATSRSGSTVTTPGAASPYARLLEMLDEEVRAAGMRTGDHLQRGVNEFLSIDPGPAPTWDAASARGRTEKYASDLDRLSGDFYKTAASPIDDEVESYFRDQFRKDLDDRLAARGFIGHGIGEGITSEAMRDYTMQRRDLADQRRLNFASAGANLATGAKSARDATEQLAYEYGLQDWARPRASRFEDLMRIATLGGAEAAARGASAPIASTLYGLDTGRLAKGGTSTWMDKLAGESGTRTSSASSGNQTGSSTLNLTQSPSALDSLTKTLKLAGAIPDAIKGAGTIADLGGKALSYFGF